MNPSPSIRVENLSRQYGALTALHNVSFTVNPGEIVGFLGPNGAGKSTTLRILSGIMPASSGSAWISGVCVAQNPHEIKRKIGYMPENNPLPDDMRVVEYLRFRARLKKVPSNQLRVTVEEVMEICDLTRTARRKIIGTLSKGFRQRVGIADALLGQPEIILMDEPTIGLDPHQIQGIRQLIDNLRGKLTVVLSSHILPEIERSCDRVIIINRGRIVASGTSDTLRQEFLPGNRFSLEITGDPLALLQQLKLAAFEPEIISQKAGSNGLYHISVRAAGDPNTLGTQLIQTLCRADRFVLHALAPSKPNLEEIFLAATKRSWEENNDSKPRPAKANTSAS
jgi:ABC-2 type transport system ATP-binding protein